MRRQEENDNAGRVKLRSIDICIFRNEIAVEICREFLVQESYRVMKISYAQGVVTSASMVGTLIVDGSPRTQSGSGQLPSWKPLIGLRRAPEPSPRPVPHDPPGTAGMSLQL